MSPAKQSWVRVLLLALLVCIYYFVVKPTLFRSMMSQALRGGAGSDALALTIALAVAVMVGFWVWGARQINLISRGFTRSADEVLRADPRPPVLFLRPFTADSKVLPGISRMLGFATPMEAALIVAYMRRGPGVAIGRPGALEGELPPLGAYRMVLGHESWQAEVTKLVEAAQIVALLWDGTSTPGIMWELRHVLSSTAAHKLRIFVWPGRNAREFYQVYASCKETLEALVEIEPMPALSSDRPVVLAFSGPRRVEARSYSRIWYRIGYRLLLALVLRRIERAWPTSSTPQPIPTLRRDSQSSAADARDRL